MKKIMIILAFLAMTGCETVKVIPKEHRTVKEVQYIVRVPPAELLIPPAKVPPIDVDNATQVDAAEWFIKKEKYTLELENLLSKIATFLRNEQSTLDAEAAEKNRKAHEAVLSPEKK